MSIGDEPETGKRKREPFAAIPWRVIDERLGPHALAVYCVIARHADREGHARPSMQRIADLAGVSRPTARSAVRALEAARLLVITSTKDENGVDLAHRYHLIGSGNQIATSGNQIAGEGQGDCRGSGNGVSREGQPRCHELEPIELEPIEPEQENKKSRSSVKAFAAPSVEQVREYVTSNKLNVDPEAFVDYYASNGWKVGKHSMKDWQAAVRQWSRRQASFAHKPTSRSQPGTGAGVKYDPNASTNDPSHGVF